jgi:hypothetical protein
VEIRESLDVWDLSTSVIALKKIFEIILNLEVESVLFLSIVIIVQFILVSDCVTVENQFRLKMFVRPTVWWFWRRHVDGLSFGDPFCGFEIEGSKLKWFQWGDSSET